jgi:hypothetical protein
MFKHRYKHVVLFVLLCGLIFPLTLVQAQEPPPDPRFGVVEAFWDTAAAVEAGAAWERILFQWSELQPSGPDDWNTLHVPDEWLQWAQAQGREVVGLLKNTPHWATDADPPMEASPPRGLELPVDDPANAWAVFVRRTVNFYGPRGVRRWVVWNEPDIAPGVYGQEWAGSVEEYYRLLKVAYLVIKEVDPDAQVHLAGLTFWHDRDWLKSFLAVATADPEAPAHSHFFDVVSLHIYFQTDSVDYVVNETRAALAASGLSRPIWINETNASPDADPEWPLVRPRWRVDLREQASFILQAYALGLAAGAERIAVYRLIDAGLPPGGEPFGLLRPDHSRRPAYMAYRLATRHYAGTRSARVSRQPLLAQVTLDQGGRTTRVFWARTRSEVAVTVPALAAQATLIDQEGNVQTLDGNGGSYALTLPGARCADETLGCIIGGPTYLLIEEAPSGDVADPGVDKTTPGQASDVEETPTAEPDATPLATELSRPTPSGGTVAPSATPTTSPTATPTLTPSPSPSPTVPPSATPSPTLTPTSSPTVFPSATPTLSPTLTLEPSPTPPGEPVSGAGLLALTGFFIGLLALLTGFAFWLARVQGRAAKKSRRARRK